MSNKELHFISGVGWRYDTEHSMLRRLEGHDYKGRSIYQITITLAERGIPRLGTLMKDGNGKAIVALSPLGERVRDCWLQIETRHPGVSSIALQIMPDHLHGVLFVKHEQAVHLGKMISGFKIGCSHAWWELEPEVCAPFCSPFSSPFSSPNYNSAHGTSAHGTAQGTSAQGTAHGAPLLPHSRGAKGPSLFSPGYHDSLLMGKGQLRNMVSYVLDNPRRAMIKREHPDLFRIVSNLTVGGRSFAAIGNRWLLNRPMRLQVRCHNNTSAENLRLIACQKEYFLQRGRMGAVVVSPCISPGEKEIARAALAAGLPLIVVLENGFPPLYKPPGRYFEACADGTLLMLAPWPHHTEHRMITRRQCVELNAMAASVSTDPWTMELERDVETVYR